MRLSSKRHRVRSMSGMLIGLVFLTGLGCNEITSLKQENQGALSVETLYIPANASLLVNGAIGDFECAYNRYVVGSGLFSDELSKKENKIKDKVVEITRTVYVRRKP